MITLSPAEWEVFSNYDQTFSASMTTNVSERMINRNYIQKLAELAPKDFVLKTF